MSQQHNSKANRYPFIDWLRGFFILLMVIYHFCYDLDLFGYIDTAFGKGYWVPFRYVIVIGFLSLVGVSLVLVHSKAINWSSMKKRSLQLALASLAVTVSSYFVDPRQLTVFGILQFILLASWLALPFLAYYRLSLFLGAGVFALGHLIKTPMLEPLWIHWIGMNETPRQALDYVPLFPWFGMVLIGITLGHWFFKTEQGKAVAKFEVSKITGLRQISWLLEKSGQHSLIIYLIHQPLMFGTFYAIRVL